MLTEVTGLGEFSGLAELIEIIGPDRHDRMQAAAAVLRERLNGGTLWHVNSTAAGGGVAEMLHTLVPLYRSLGVRARWAVVGGDEEFFRITKRLGTNLYGSPADHGPLGADEHSIYLDGLARAATRFGQLLGADDVVILHDHQTAGLVQLLAGRPAASFWRCHVGVDVPNEWSQRAWRFLEPLLGAAQGTIFSVAGHVPDVVAPERATVLPPFISPLVAKNRELTGPEVDRALTLCGLRPALRREQPKDYRSERLRRRATIVSTRFPEPHEPLAVQISRWDRLKDMDGVLTAFADHAFDGYLALAGPDPDSIPDDVEQRHWYDTCRTAWQRLPARAQARIALLCLPMADLDENAVMVNALQRSADVVLQKSLAEGFGLTVAEAMWKRRVVVASAVGGIRCQIDHGVNGYLLDDPYDHAGFTALVEKAMDSDSDKWAVGERAHERVRTDFLPDREISITARLVSTKE